VENLGHVRIILESDRCACRNINNFVETANMKAENLTASVAIYGNEGNDSGDC
jgi:hypothetical protein